MTHHEVLIVGGGTAGLMLASQWKRKHPEIDLGIVEPSKNHWYQPAWTLVGADTFSMKKTRRNTADFIPKGTTWIQDYAESFDLKNRQVQMKSGDKVSYDYLVVAPGLVMKPSLVEGLTEALDKGVVCSNYTNPEFTKEVLKNFDGGTALFTQPTTPIKCGGAPQKMMYLADDQFRNMGIRDKTKMVYATPGGVIFGVKPIAKTLTEVIDRKDINVRYGHRLVALDGDKRIAWYELGDNVSDYNHKDVEVSKDGNRVGIHFDMVHLAPPQAAPEFIAKSELVNDTGWVDVDSETLQHKRFPDVFSLGDVAGLPTAKTGAAVRKQVPVVIDGIMRLRSGKKLGSERYNGYSSCPLVTGYGKMVLAEFDYNSAFTPDPKLKRMLISDSSKELRRLWWLKKYILPWLYWNRILKGREV